MSVTPVSLDPFEEVQRLVGVAVASAGPQFHSAILAGQILEDIKQNQPALWDAWSAVVALDQLKIAIGRSRQLAKRAHSPLARRGFSLTEEVDGSHTIRQVGDMIRSDLDYVARSYQKRATTNSLRAKRFRALRDRLPDDTTRVRDCIPEADIESIYA